MTRHEKQLAEALLGDLPGASPGQTLARLFSLGLIDRRACEAHAIRAETERLVRQGTPRCAAMEITARTFCCSYGKVREILYNHKKP